MESTTGQGEAMPQAPAAPPNATRSTPAAAQTQPSGFSGPLPKDATAQPQMQDRASVQASAGAQQYPPPPTTPPVIPGSAPLFAPWPTMTQTAPNPQGHPPMSFAPGAYGHMPPLPPVQPIELSPEKPRPMLADFLLAVAMVVVGFFFWEWHLITMPFGAPAGIGVTILFLATTAAACGYLYVKGVRPTLKSSIALAVVVLGALPFVLYGARGINIILSCFEFLAALTWIALACQTTLKPYLSGFVVFDAMRQTFVVAFRDYFRIFSAFGFLFRGRLASHRSHALLWSLVGLLISIPILAFIMTLLNDADDSFRNITESIALFMANLELGDLLTDFLNLILGIPVACYLFGLLYGSYRDAHNWGLVRLRTHSEEDHASEVKTVGGSASSNTAQTVCRSRAEHADHTIASCHRIPRPALYAPLVCFIFIYLVFFVGMGSYLFSAWQGQIPATFTYAQYARQGFFELCTIAFINLIVLGVVYLFCSREARCYPRILRVLTGMLSACTCLLIATAMSKMYLYIQAYGLSPLRVYTFWFMAVLMVVFLILLAWHFKPFNAARPLVVGVTVLVLALGLSNTNGFIAQYNVDRYLSGQTDEIDIAQLQNLYDAAVPAFCDLADNAPDSEVRSQAEQALKLYSIESQFVPRDANMLNISRADLEDWATWNILGFQADALVHERYVMDQ